MVQKEKQRERSTDSGLFDSSSSTRNSISGRRTSWSGLAKRGKRQAEKRGDLKEGVISGLMMLGGAAVAGLILPTSAIPAMLGIGVMALLSGEVGVGKWSVIPSSIVVGLLVFLPMFAGIFSIFGLALAALTPVVATIAHSYGE